MDEEIVFQRKRRSNDENKVYIFFKMFWSIYLSETVSSDVNALIPRNL